MYVRFGSNALFRFMFTGNSFIHSLIYSKVVLFIVSLWLSWLYVMIGFLLLSLRQQVNKRTRKKKKRNETKHFLCWLRNQLIQPIYIHGHILYLYIHTYICIYIRVTLSYMEYFFVEIFPISPPSLVNIGKKITKFQINHIHT